MHVRGEGSSRAMLATARPSYISFNYVTSYFLSTLAIQLRLPKTPGSLIRISPNFHKMYRNDSRLTCWNQNFYIQIRFRTSVCQMKENREILYPQSDAYFVSEHYSKE